MGQRVGLKWVLGLNVLCSVAGFLETGCITATAPAPRPQPAPKAQSPVPAPTQVVESDQSAEVPVRLTIEHISPVIAAAAPRIKSQCWQPALDARAPDAPPNARVVVQAQIDASGKVAAVQTDGSPPDYP